MKKEFRTNEVMRERALTMLLIVWNTKNEEGKHIYSRYHSVDNLTNRRNAHWEPGARRLEDKVLRRHIGSFKSAILYLNTPKGMNQHVLKKWNQKGQEVVEYENIPEHKN